MNPAERYAALKLLETGLKSALRDAAAEAEEYRAQVRAKALETDFGTVTVTRRKPTVIVTDDDALIAWCEDEMPNLVQKSITAEARSWLLDKRFEITGDDVIDPATGESVPFLAVKAGSEFLTFRPTDDAKASTAAIAAQITERVAELSAPALPEGDPA